MSLSVVKFLNECSSSKYIPNDKQSISETLMIRNFGIRKLASQMNFLWESMKVRNFYKTCAISVVPNYQHLEI